MRPGFPAPPGGRSRPGRIGQPKELAHLVETLARGIVHSRAQQPVLGFALDAHQHRVAAADDESQVRLELRKVRGGRAARNPGRIEMGLVVVNAEERPPQGKRDGLSGLEAHQQGAGQARALGGRHGIEPGGAHPGLRQSGARHRQQVPQVLARRQLRHHAPILGVQRDLGRNDVGQDPPLLDQGGAGLVTGSLDG